MSINQSNLSADTSFDLVYAVTQDSLNYVIKNYLLNGTFPVISKYYVKDASNNISEIDYNSLMMSDIYVDPLNLPTINNPNNSNGSLMALRNVNFVYAYQFQLGIPDCIDDLLDFFPLTLNSDNTAGFNLVCKEFKVVDATYSADGTYISKLTAASQTEAQWSFTYNVPLANVDGSGNYPPDVQAQVKSLGNNPFSVKKLILDFTNPTLKESFSVPGVLASSPIYKALNSLFATQYYGAMQNFGEPAFNYTITQGNDTPASLTISNVAMEAQPFVNAGGQPVTDPNDPNIGLATLNFQCTTNGNPAQPAKVLPWNWLDSTDDEKLYQGAIAINRNTLKNYFKQELDAYVSSNCYIPSITVTNVDGVDNWSFALTPGGTPEMEGDNNALHYTWYPVARAYNTAKTGYLVLNPQLEVIVAFAGKTITITQLQQMQVVSMLPGAHGAQITSRYEYIDTYTLITDSAAKTLDMSCASQFNTVPPMTNPNIGLSSPATQQLMDEISASYASLTATNFKEVPLSFGQKFIFPGGNTFSFQNAQFSQYQDLVAQIDYVTAV